MKSTKDIGRDVHQETISVAVRNAAGKGVMESILETRAATMVQLIRGLRQPAGDLGRRNLWRPGCMIGQAARHPGHGMQSVRTLC